MIFETNAGSQVVKTTVWLNLLAEEFLDNYSFELSRRSRHSPYNQNVEPSWTLPSHWKQEQKELFIDIVVEHDYNRAVANDNVPFDKEGHKQQYLSGRLKMPKSMAVRVCSDLVFRTNRNKVESPNPI